jgi:hypothetical protein
MVIDCSREQFNWEIRVDAYQPAIRPTGECNDTCAESNECAYLQDRLRLRLLDDAGDLPGFRLSDANVIEHPMWNPLPSEIPVDRFPIL